jgi:NAD(P)-dependent dehydrogenase (short-subunit alcohol dehydrogenase family)
MTLGLAAAGVRVLAADLPSSHNEMSEVLDTARKQGLHDRILPVDCDVTQWRDCTNATKTAIDRFGAVHGLVNNAGVGMRGFGHVQVGARAKFYEHDVDAWRPAIDANVNGPFMMAKAVAPALVAQAGAGSSIMDGFSPYGPSKAALEAATIIWARDLAGTDVTVNALLPGGPLISTASDGVTGRRFIVKAWDSALPLAEAAKKAGASAGWEINAPKPF